MSTIDLARALRFASPGHRRSRLDPLDGLERFLRVGAIGLMGAVIWIHLHLWLDGYRHIPTIGPLFLVASVGTFALAAFLLAWPSRLVGLVASVANIAILGSLIASINIGLFGFKEIVTAPFVVESIVIEAIAAPLLIAWVTVDHAVESRWSRPTGRAPAAPEHSEEHSWNGRAQQAEADADRLARALEFHIVNECNCHGAGDIATLRRHELRVVARHNGQHELDVSRAGPGARIVGLHPPGPWGRGPNSDQRAFG